MTRVDSTCCDVVDGSKKLRDVKKKRVSGQGIRATNVFPTSPPCVLPIQVLSNAVRVL